MAAAASRVCNFFSNEEWGGYNHYVLRLEKIKIMRAKYHQFENLNIEEGLCQCSASGRWQNGEIDVLSVATTLSSYVLSFNYFVIDDEPDRFRLRIDNRVTLIGYKSGEFMIRDCDTLGNLCKVLDLVNYVQYLQNIESVRYLFNTKN